MPAPAHSAGKKRKSNDGNTAQLSTARKRQKNQDARNITTQTADAALSTNGELNIASFVKAREFEINALDKSMRKARQNLASRAFQQVPRHLRRRTASHNVKKVPRRLHKRAEREMKEDKTPTVTPKSRTPSAKLRLRLENMKALKALTTKRRAVRQNKKDTILNAKETDPAKHTSITRVPRIKKNKLAEASRATSKFKRRQVSKTWLPTHLWHTKRAHMTRPTEPLWRMAVPLSPTEKCYRPSHRAANNRGCIAWDMSYMSTIGCIGTDTALEGMLKAIGFNGEGWLGRRYQRWKNGTRFSASWVRERDEDRAPISPVEVIWKPREPQEKEKLSGQHFEANMEIKEGTGTTPTKRVNLNRRIMMRVHPSAFQKLWLEVIKVAKTQKPQVLLEDLRFQIGSIDVTGPGSTEALAGVLRPFDSDDAVAKIWPVLTNLSNPTSLPANVMLPYSIADPRLDHPPKRIKLADDDASIMLMHEMTVNWPLDDIASSHTFFSYKARHSAGQLLSQRAINRRRVSALPGQQAASLGKTPEFPIVLLAHRSSSISTNLQGTWSILAPWNCIDPIWRSLMYYPLKSGDTPRFGGLSETRQIAFEQAVPWYPGDFPGTEAGKAWDRTESEQRFDSWVRKPPSRRLPYHSVDLGLERRGELGRGWACDWEYMFEEKLTDTSGHTQPKITRSTRPDRANEILLTQRQRKAAKAKEQSKTDKDNRRRNTSSPESDTDADVVDHNLTAGPKFSQMIPSVAAAHLRKALSSSNLPSTPCLMTVRITLLTRGTPNPTARIYRLPKALAGTPPAKRSIAAPHVENPTPTPTNRTPPAAQPSPSLLPSTASNSIPTSEDLRERWLALDPQSPSSVLPRRIQKDRLNRHSLARKATHLPVPSLRQINVLPKDAPKEVVDTYGPKPPSQSDQQAEIEALTKIKLDEEKVWEVHVPCPDVEDLVGFVTSGAYNLAEGKGTAIGGLWVHRVIEGWIRDEEVAGGNRVVEDMKARKGRERRVERQRKLCIVRNSGESVGRLAIWEVCE